MGLCLAILWVFYILRAGSVWNNLFFRSFLYWTAVLEAPVVFSNKYIKNSSCVRIGWWKHRFWGAFKYSYRYVKVFGFRQLMEYENPPESRQHFDVAPGTHCFWRSLYTLLRCHWVCSFCKVSGECRKCNLHKQYKCILETKQYLPINSYFGLLPERERVIVLVISLRLDAAKSALKPSNIYRWIPISDYYESGIVNSWIEITPIGTHNCAQHWRTPTRCHSYTGRCSEGVWV